MPEGDTIFRVARRLRMALLGKTIARAQARQLQLPTVIDAGSLAGLQVTQVESRGKHLVIGFSDHRVLHSHLGMTGSWHIYLPGQSWRKPARRAGIVLMTDTSVVVNFNPQRLELISQDSVRHDPSLVRLGPDLAIKETDVAEVLPRIRRFNSTAIGQAVMNQSVVAGIGNIYKSESLFLRRIHPWSCVEELDDDRLVDYLRYTQKLIRRNCYTGGMRITRWAADGPRLWVYGRHGEACLQCGTQIRLSRQGEQARTTYWCPTCQQTEAG